MRALIWLVAAFAALYGGYWVVGSRTMLAGVETALADWQTAGVADYGEVTLQGFPSRFDLTVTEPEWQSPDGSVQWAAERLNVYALSYKPHHVIAVLPPEQTLRLGREVLRVHSADLRASALFGLATSLPVDHAQMVGKAVKISSDAGWGLIADELRLAIRKGASGTEQELGAALIAPELTGILADYLGTALPARGERIHLDALLTLEAPLDRFSPVRGIRVQVADIRDFDLDWGPVGLRGSGQLALGPTRRPEGRLDLSIRNWPRALEAATDLGLIRAENVQAVRRALTLLALTSGNGDDLTLPLIFSNGLMNLGPVPLGPAPRL